MKPVSLFMPRVLPYVMGCPEPMAIQAVVDYAIAFCEDSLVIRQKLDPVTTSPGTASYELDSPAGQQVARVLQVWVGQELIHVTASDAPAPVNPPTGRPRACYTTRTDSTLELVLFPPPNAVYTVTVEAALRPVRDAAALEDDLYNLWVEAIRLGAIGQLMQVPGQAFSDPMRGMDMAARALQLSRKARIEGGLGRVRANHTVRANPFI